MDIWKKVPMFINHRASSFKARKKSSTNCGRRFMDLNKLQGHDSVDDRKSTSGSMFNLGLGTVSWASKKQSTVVLSSFEVEYIAASTAACQAIRMRRILEDMYQKQKQGTEIFCDNMAAVAMAKNLVFYSKSKHIEIKHHFIQEVVAEAKIMLKGCSISDQVADGFTKVLPHMKFLKFRDSLLVTDFASRESDEL